MARRVCRPVVIRGTCLKKVNCKARSKIAELKEKVNEAGPIRERGKTMRLFRELAKPLTAQWF